MAFSWDSCEVGPFRDAGWLPVSAAALPAPPAPLPAEPLPPLPPPAGPLALGLALLGLGSPALLTLSLLTERLSVVFPRVSGGGGFSWTGFALLLAEAILAPSPVFEVARPDKPTGFWLFEEAAGFPLALCAVDPSLAVDGLAEEVLAAKAAHPVRPLVAEEETLVLAEFPETAAEV